MNTYLEYIWLDSNNHFRSKTKIIFNNLVVDLKDVPEWNYDGSSTGQADTNDSEIMLVPIFLCPDPFRGKNHRLVYCACYKDSHALLNNNYSKATDVFDSASVNYYKPWFGMEQEFFIMDNETEFPINFNKSNKQGKYYCNIDEAPITERNIMEEFIEKSEFSRIKVCGINAEVAQGQWEYQIGPCLGIEIGHHMMISRYILCRIANKYNCHIDFSPKPLGNEWNGSGCHTNYSTIFTRNGDQEKSGLMVIYEYIEALKDVHKEMMEEYGKDNHLRMTGNCETANYDTFNYSVGGRTTSIRIGNETNSNKKGYFEDRRPSSNCDPYLVAYLLFYHTCIKCD